MRAISGQPARERWALPCIRRGQLNAPRLEALTQSRAPVERLNVSQPTPAGKQHTDIVSGTTIK